MSYSQTMTRTKNNSSSKGRLSLTTTSQQKQYNYELMYFIFEQVKEALKKRSKTDLSSKDLNSVELLIEAERRTNKEIANRHLVTAEGMVN